MRFMLAVNIRLVISSWLSLSTHPLRSCFFLCREAEANTCISPLSRN